VRITGIILAAGSSSRMTKYKQLLNFRGQSLIKDIVEKATNLGLSKVVCVTGFLEEQLQNELSQYCIDYVHNPQHSLGMMTSLQVALQSSCCNQSDAILVMLSDQPLIPQEHYEEMLALAQSEEALISTGYAGTNGVPVIIGANYFEDILALDSESSPKKILELNKQQLEVLPCESAAYDIDTDADYSQLIGQYE